MQYAQQIMGEVRKAVVGKDRVLLWSLATILARGHILLEDIPGVGKTTLALAFSRALGLTYGRVQFTPDVLPSDVTGYSIYNKETGAMTYQPGAVLCNLFLADELNRATSRTQSALLEAMEEGQVTVDGQTTHPPALYRHCHPESGGRCGTQLLPDSQMDRFTIRLSMGYPAPKDERDMILRRQEGNPLLQIHPVLTRGQLVELQDQAAGVYIQTELVDYVVRLIGATRSHPSILRGASPRATLSVTAMAKSIAFLNGRDYVIPSDVQTVFCDTVAHRLLLEPGVEARGRTAREILEEILKGAAAPRVS